MKSKFQSIRFGLVVGVGGGVPSTDVRLGDVVVSQPHKEHGGVVQYEFVKSTPDGFQRTGSLNLPPEILLSALSTLQSNYLMGRNRLSDYLSTLVKRRPDFCREKAGPDVLFLTNYDHVGGDTCAQCCKDKQVQRVPRENHDVLIHYGTIASGDRVMRHATERDDISKKLGGVLCFEMEAAGLMNRFPCLVIRGICDYADSHKNKKWQPYATATAAVYAKEFLSVISAAEVVETHTVDETMKGKDGE
jgi:nucleoside phosphorylase